MYIPNTPIKLNLETEDGQVFGGQCVATSVRG